MVDEKQFGRQITRLRKEAGFTQEELADRLHVTPQAVSKWENGHSLPETALLPVLARLLRATIDELFNPKSLVVLEAFFGDGMDVADVTKRLNRLVEDEALDITVVAMLLGVDCFPPRTAYLTVKYQVPQGICYAAFPEGAAVRLTRGDVPNKLPEGELEIIAGCYGTKPHHYDAMPKIRHYRPFNWEAYYANHETFPSDPANDETEYLTLVYLNGSGIHMATCAEGEMLAYQDSKTKLVRRSGGRDGYIRNIPKLPPFGKGMECSWAAALTAALQAMGIQTDYEEVMGVSGACYRLAFCSPGWDYSSADGLVAYDYATPSFAAYGFTPLQYAHIDKEDRAEHRTRIVKEIQNSMPVLGINLRVAPEWGVICGYDKDGERLFCRTKYDRQTIDNDPEFMKCARPFEKEDLGPDEMMAVDNWPFLLCYFDGKRMPPTPKENLLASLRVFVDCADRSKECGYFTGFEAYTVWAADLRDDAFYESCEDELMARRFSVNQFCVLSLADARKAAYSYLQASIGLFAEGGAERDIMNQMTGCFEESGGIAERIHHMLDSGEELDGMKSRLFWTAEKRCLQAAALDEMARLEQEAYALAVKLIRGMEGTE